MSWLLDTNVLSETTRPQPSALVLAWLAAQPVDECFLSVITVGELWRGALLLSAGKKRKALLEWIQDDILAGFAGRIVPIDIAVMERWGALQATAERAGHRLPLMDSLLAATALTHELTLVTRNTSDFAKVDLPLLDPWQ